jgi:rod shape-determining protein MreC
LIEEEAFFLYNVFIMRKRKQTTFILFMSFLSLSVLFYILFIVVSADRLVNNLQQRGYSVLGSISYTLFTYPFESANQFIDDFLIFSKLKDEQRITQAELDRLAAFRAELEESYRQIRELKQLLKLKESMMDFSTIPFRVTSRSADSFSSIILINGGYLDGVEQDQAVITSLGLIGKVETVFERSSIVRLLTSQDVDNKVSVRIQLSPTSTAEAVLDDYNPNTGLFRLILLDTNTSVNVGSTVITSGLGGVYPSGLLVGNVEEIEQLPNSVSARIWVKPSASFMSFDYVLVVKVGINDE